MMATIENGVQRWRDDKNRIHRDHGLPAVIHLDGTREWWVHDKRQRAGDLPVIVRADGSKEWMRSRAAGFDVYHRDRDLPAVVGPDGCLEWFVDGRIPRRPNGLPVIMFPDGCHAWHDDVRQLFDLKVVTDFTPTSTRFVFVKSLQT